MLSAAPTSPLVLVVGRPGDAIAAAVASYLRDVLPREHVELETADVDGAEEIGALVERHRERIGALVVGAVEPTSASTLVWDIDRSSWLAARTLVVVDERPKLDSVPGRLRDALTYVAVNEGDYEDVAALVTRMLDQPGEVDVLASLVRSAIERRSVESLPPLLGDWSGADAIDVSMLRVAHVGDEGRRPNPLWAQWVQRRDSAAIERLRQRIGDLRGRDEPNQGAELPSGRAFPTFSNEFPTFSKKKSDT